MKKEKYSFEFERFESKSELAAEQKKVVEEAYDISLNAYAPYSQFNVGAAVLLANGQIITGSNQENAAYPSGLCAERVALFYASSHYPGIPVEVLAVTAVTAGKQVERISPCGGCRQVMKEVENRYKQPVRLLLCGREEILCLESAEDLLPLSFGESDLLL